MDMTDELTPEERDALKDLPRERAPSAGLEDRVVAAMRDRGHLVARKPARVIRITSTRMVGLLAACAVLVIGAYSIGLYRGVDRSVLTNIEPRGDANTSGFAERSSASSRESGAGVRPPASGTESAARSDAQPATQPLPVRSPSARDEDLAKRNAPPLEWKLDAVPLVAPKDAKKEKAVKEDDVANNMAQTFSDQLSSKKAAAPPPAAAAAAPAPAPARAQLQSGAVAESAKPSRSFALKGGTLMVDAPDSVRVVQDAEGRTLLIYTSEGIIRIRLAD
jgi:hypothetical protein